jgi:hypothetical protein
LQGLILLQSPDCSLQSSVFGRQRTRFDFAND